MFKNINLILFFGKNTYKIFCKITLLFKKIKIEQVVNETSNN